VVRTGINLPCLLSYFTSNCPPEAHLKQSDDITYLQKPYRHTTLQSASDHIPRVASWWNTILSEFIFLTRYKVACDISDITYPAHVRLTTNRALLCKLQDCIALTSTYFQRYFRNVSGCARPSTR